MDRREESGFTLMELLIVVAIISIIAAIALPGLMRSRMTGNESSAIASLRVTTSSQIGFAAACGQGGFADNYPTLGLAPFGGAGQGFISADMAVAAPLKSGFRFELNESSITEPTQTGLNDCHGNPAVTGFYATATPLAPSTTGARAFAVNTTMTIWQSFDPETPPTEEQIEAGEATEDVAPISPIQ